MARERGSDSVYFTDISMALMYISIKPSPGPVHPSCPIRCSPDESKGPEVGSLTVQSPEVHESFRLKPERCAVLPCAEDVLCTLLCAFPADRTHLQMPKPCP